MLKPLITIDDWSAGILQDSTIPARNGFNFSQGIDISTEPGILQSSQDFTGLTVNSVATTLATPIYFFATYSGDSKVYGYGYGNLWNYNGTASGTWATVLASGSGPNTPGGLFEYGGTLYYATNTTLNTFDNYVINDSFQGFQADDSEWHPMVEYLGKLFVGDGRYIASYDASTNTWNATALTLPSGVRVRCMKVFGDRIVIGTWRGSNIYEYNEAILFTWNGTDTFAEQSFSIKEAGIHSLFHWKNNLLVFAGIQGNIYIFNGASLEKFTNLPKVPTGGLWDEYYPDAMTEYFGNVLFGVSNRGGGNESGGIYSLIQKNPNDPISICLSHILSTGETSDIYIYSIFLVDRSTIYVSYKDANGLYRVDTISLTTKISVANPYIDTQIYEIAKDNNPTLLKGIEIVAKPMVTAISTSIAYKLDNAAGWTGFGTINSTNQDYVYKGFGRRAKTVQLRVEMINSANFSPQISAIKIY